MPGSWHGGKAHHKLAFDPNSINCAAACMQFRQKLANFGVFVARQFFDRITSYNLESMNERKWLRRILFLETVAGAAHTAPIYCIHIVVEYASFWFLLRGIPVDNIGSEHV